MARRIQKGRIDLPGKVGHLGSRAGRSRCSPRAARGLAAGSGAVAAAGPRSRRLATLRDVHLKLYGELGRYHQHVKSRSADAVFRAPDADFTGSERLEGLTRNLVRALSDEAILLVLDNFEWPAWRSSPTRIPTGARTATSTRSGTA